MRAAASPLFVTFAILLGACTHDFDADLAACRAGGWCSGATQDADGGAGPASSAPPQLSGNAAVGARLIAAPGTWTSERAISYAFRWERCPIFADGVPCAEIADAGEPEYDVAPLDVDNALRVVVTASDEAGVATASSEITAAVSRSSPARIDSFTGFEGGSLPEGAGILGTASSVMSGSSRAGSYALAMDGGVFVGFNRPAPVVFRAALRVDALPEDAGTRLLHVQPESGGLVAHWDLLPDGRVAARHVDTGPVSSTHALVPGEWHTLELLMSESTSGTEIEWRLDGALQQPITATSALEASLTLVIGLKGTVPLQVDDVAFSSDAAEWPLGDGEAIALWPDADGTHQNETAFVRVPASGSFAAAVDDGSFGDSADYLEQTTESGTAYLEFDLTHSRPIRTFANAMRVSIGFGQSMAPASPGRVRLFLGSDPIGEQLFATEAAYSHQTSATFAAADAGWTDARLSSELRARWGYAVPATGASYTPVRLHRLLVEADVAR